MMTWASSEQSHPQSEADQRLQYEAPAIVYEGVITTRAGSPAGVTPGDSDAGVDPSDLFKGDN